MNNIVKFNPVLDATREIFKQSIADSPLDFQVSTDGILLKHYKDLVPECSDKKAVIKHDDDGNPLHELCHQPVQELLDQLQYQLPLSVELVQ